VCKNCRASRSLLSLVFNARQMCDVAAWGDLPNNYEYLIARYFPF
jgi:hypothetical protein